jgi:hypothetical protein
MPSLATVTLLLFGFNSVALAAPPSATNIMKSHVGKVTRVNRNPRTFTGDWKLWNGRSRNAQGFNGSDGREATFKATDNTTYTVGTNNSTGSWSNLKVGVHLNVKDHAEGSDLVADTVHIVSGP